MTFSELRDYIDAMDSKQRQQTVSIHDSDGNWHVELAITGSGFPLLIYIFGDEDDGSEMVAS